MTAPSERFSGEQLAEVSRLQDLYPDKRGALLPVLHMAQETFGYISLQAEEYVDAGHWRPRRTARGFALMSNASTDSNVSPGRKFAKSCPRVAIQ